MLNLFESVSKLVKYSQKVEIHNFVFKLHFKVTFVWLIVCSILVTSTQYIGDPIDCLVDEVPHEIMDTYCWIYSTFTVTDRFEERIGKDVVQPGVALHNDETPIKRHKYYQWVCFVLFFQAILFYLPHYLWKTVEGEKVKTLVTGLKFRLSTTEENQDRINAISVYYDNYKNNNSLYAIKYFFCEFLNWLNVTLQVVLVDWFLDWQFTSYGFKVFDQIHIDPEIRRDPMSFVFPKVTKCTFHKYGPTGTVQDFDGLCILPVNIINEKIYLFLWFWLAALFIITSGSLVYRIVWWNRGDVRKKDITSECLFVGKNKILYLPKSKTERINNSSINDEYFTTSETSLCTKTGISEKAGKFNLETKETPKLKDVLKQENIEHFCNNISIGNIFFLTLIGRNTDSVIFNQILAKIITGNNGKAGKVYGDEDEKTPLLSDYDKVPLILKKMTSNNETGSKASFDIHDVTKERKESNVNITSQPARESKVQDDEETSQKYVKRQDSETKNSDAADGFNKSESEASYDKMPSPTADKSSETSALNQPDLISNGNISDDKVPDDITSDQVDSDESYYSAKDQEALKSEDSIPESLEKVVEDIDKNDEKSSD